MYKPLAGEYIAVGIVGALLYGLVAGYAFYALWLGVTCFPTRLFFVLLLIMAALEIPQYFEMVAKELYASKAAYSAHILAGNFFFSAFSIVCYQWGKLLEIGSTRKVLFGRNGLFAANILFLIVDVVSMSLCLTSDSLNDFFQSDAYLILTVIEGVKNCVYAAVLSYDGILLVRKLWSYSQDELRHTSLLTAIYTSLGCRQPTHVTADEEEMKDLEEAGTRSSFSTLEPENIFLGVVIRLAYVLLLTTVCFALRVCMVTLTILALRTTQPVTAPSFALFGFLWTVFADFIPRVLPCLAFIQLMQNKRPVGLQTATTPRPRWRARTRSTGSDKAGLIKAAASTAAAVRTHATPAASPRGTPASGGARDRPGQRGGASELSEVSLE
jgi:hypothetical protein